MGTTPDFQQAAQMVSFQQQIEAILQGTLKTPAQVVEITKAAYTYIIDSRIRAGRQDAMKALRAALGENGQRLTEKKQSDILRLCTNFNPQTGLSEYVSPEEISEIQMQIDVRELADVDSQIEEIYAPQLGWGE